MVNLSTEITDGQPVDEVRFPRVPFVNAKPALGDNGAGAVPTHDRPTGHWRAAGVGWVNRFKVAFVEIDEFDVPTVVVKRLPDEVR